MIENVKTALSALTKPKQAFAKVSERQMAVWIAAMVMISLVLLIKPVVTAPAMQAETQKAMQAELKNPDMPPEARAQIRKSVKDGIPAALILLGGVGQTIALWAGAALSALLVMGLVKLFKGTIAYKGALAVIGLAFMPFFAGEIIKTAAAFFTGSLGASEGMASLLAPPAGQAASASFSSSPGYILAGLTLSRIDIFVIWSLFLLAIGVIDLAGLSKAKGAALAASYWVLAWAVVAIPATGSLLLFAPMMSSTVRSGP